MFLHSLKQILRSLWKHKNFSLINLLGLSVGIAAVVVLYLIAGYEKAFDSFHAGAASIYRVVLHSPRNGTLEKEASVPYPTAKFLRNELPGLLATQVQFTKNANVRIGAASPFAERNIVFADSLFFSVLDFSGINRFVVTGDPVKALSAPGKAVLTESTAKRYFGSENPIGKTFKIDAKLEVEVAAIIRDVPANTHLPLTMLVSYASLTNDFIGGLDLNSWGFRSNGYCYVKPDAKAGIATVEKALHAVNKKNSESEREKRETFLLQPLRQIHFDTAFESSNPAYTVNARYLTMLLLLGGFILLIACVNYINLSTSLAFSKSKEVGVRKTIGASRGQLFFHYMSETLVLTFCATFAGCLIAAACLPAVNRLLDKSLAVSQLLNVFFVVKALAVLVVVSFVSGVYPALILSRFNPIASLKNGLVLPGKWSTLLRKALVVFQFTTSIALVICTLVIARQMTYFNSKSLGFNKDAVVEVGLPSPDSAKRESFRALLQNQSGIEGLSFCLGAPVSDNGVGTSMKAPELAAGTDYNVKIIPCDKSYLSTYGIQLVAGRWFLAGEEKNLGSGLVVNEALVNMLGYKKPGEALGKKLTIGINDYNATIIGVTKDFHTSSLHERIGAVALMPFPFFYYAAGVRINPNNLRGTLAQVETAFKKVYPEHVYSVTFVDEHLATLYAEETKNYTLFKAFSAISIFICAIGLWGLIAFVVVRKTKEIGIRKVLGASVASIVALLSKDFVKLVGLALLVASPLAWLFMHQWLQNYAYRISIGWWVFALAGLFAVAVALLSISFQAIKAAVANPVKSLRTE